MKQEGRKVKAQGMASPISSLTSALATTFYSVSMDSIFTKISHDE